jgi:hypothetical protein
MLVDVLPSYLCACVPTTGTCPAFLPKMTSVMTTWERLRVHLALGGVTQRRDWKATGRYEAGNQYCQSITVHHGRDQDGTSVSESSSEVPGVIPAGTQWPAQRWPANTGWLVLFFWSNIHNSTSIHSRVHVWTAWHGMGAKGTWATCTRSHAASNHASKLHVLTGWALTPDHKAGGDLFLFFLFTRFQGTGKH